MRMGVGYHGSMTSQPPVTRVTYCRGVVVSHGWVTFLLQGKKPWYWLVVFHRGGALRVIRLTAGHVR